ncbi:uncharacterized protein BO97DRAFT_405034 [Aspergillus homomorphus CBS 101889]|uniref:Apple domain-containing protein n=1 Tax=Aspergillus homomorphus (strain CBS 101889) TaxID=1450537 RepID=A0A395I091_ASPHC|nr:hypothetical protein BO97DRAFT_405034 [Aspergillus homomorphus CBS 101889]RAL13155.1 hypothetical protein BO97DRAFT_405034 [Aspergillus homomorphus CBS 101889]
MEDGLHVVQPGQRIAADGRTLETLPDTDTHKEVWRDGGGLIHVSGPQKPTVTGRPIDFSSDNRRICGLETRRFWWILAIVLIVIIGAAIGGGIGGSRASEANRAVASSSVTKPLSATGTSVTSAAATTRTASVTSSAPITSGTIGIAANPCPGQNLTTLTASDGSIFTLLCAVDWPKGDAGLYGNKTVGDLDFTTRYTLESCIADCVRWNRVIADTPCKGVVYSANLTASFDGGQDGNCFLKSEVGVYFPNSNTSMAAGLLAG